KYVLTDCLFDFAPRQVGETLSNKRIKANLPLFRPNFPGFYGEGRRLIPHTSYRSITPNLIDQDA
ncbi:MAG TPA: hypothetical protein VKH62_06005, partial [Candidatus Binatia bacterium]|nr:hypothetical protein [Candidatus Binatia bacterium]